MEHQKIINLLGTTLDEVSRFITKKWVEVEDQSGNAEDRCNPSKQIQFKTSMLRSDYVILVTHILLLKELLLLQIKMMQIIKKSSF